MEEEPATVLANYQKALSKNQRNTLLFVLTVLDLTEYILNNQTRIKPDVTKGYLFIFCNDLFDTDPKAQGGKLYRLTKESNFNDIKTRAMGLLRRVHENESLLNLLKPTNKSLVQQLITEEDEMKRAQEAEQEKTKRSRSHSSPDGAQRNPESLTHFFDPKKQKSDSPPVPVAAPQPEPQPELTAYKSLVFSPRSSSSSRSSSGSL